MINRLASERKIHLGTKKKETHLVVRIVADNKQARIDDMAMMMDLYD